MAAARLFQAVEDDCIGAVNGGGVETGQVDAGGSLGVVPHAFADDAYGDAFGLRGGGPTVAGYIHGQVEVQAEGVCNLLEAAVYVVACIAVGAAGIDGGRLDDGEEIGRSVCGVFVEDGLHVRGPLYDEPFSGFVAAVGEVAVVEVGFLEVGHVHKTHAAKVEAEHEHVAGVVKAGRQCKVKRFEFLDNVQWQGSFRGLVYSCIDLSEGVSVFDDAFPDGLVVGCAQYAVIEGDGVWG